MTYIAPNLSSIIGASTAAKLMGAAGGLTALSKVMFQKYYKRLISFYLIKSILTDLSQGFDFSISLQMPANYVALLGQQKKVLAGYSQSSTLPHTGFIYYSDLVQKLPPVSVDIYKL